MGGGPPIVAAGLVWTIGHDGTLYGLDPSTGTVRQQVSIGVPANHFPTPSIGDGLLLAPSSNRVVAFHATPTSTPTSSTSTTSTPTSSTSTTTTTVPRSSAAGASGSSSGGGSSPGEIAGIVVGSVIVLGGAGWVLLRRRRRSAGP